MQVRKQVTPDFTQLFNRSFTIMAVGQFISLFGNSLQRFALSLLILDLTGSAAVFSGIVALTFLPQILLAPFGGAIADRISKQKIMVFLDAFSGLFLLLFTLFFLGNGSPSVPAVAVLMLVMAVIQSIYDPSVRASIPAVTAPENLSSANGIVTVISSLTALLGPIAAGFLYGLRGIEIVFVINIVSFLLSAVLELFLYIPHTAGDLTGHVLRTFLGDIRHTFSYLTHEKPLILQMILVSCSLNLFMTPLYTVGLPFVEKIVFGVSDQLYGISEGFIGAGMIVGALLTGLISQVFPFRKLHCYFWIITALVAGMSVICLPIVMGTGEVSYLSYGLLTAIGFIFALALAVVNILCMTFMQREIPQDYMGKSMALITALSTALMPVGQVIFGGLYDVFADRVYILHGLVAVLCLVATLVTRRLMHKAIVSGKLT